MNPEEIIDIAKMHDIDQWTNYASILAFATEIRNRTLDEAADYMESNDAGYAHNIRALKGDKK